MLWNRQLPSPGTCRISTDVVMRLRGYDRDRGPYLPRMLAKCSHSPGVRGYRLRRNPWGSIFEEGFHGG